MGGDEPSTPDSGGVPPPPDSPAPAGPPAEFSTEPAPVAPARDSQGRFIKAPSTPAPAVTPPSPVDPSRQATLATKDASTAAMAAPGSAPGAPAGRVSGPPPGWSVASKAAYDQLPDAVKADIAKREQEVASGFARLTELRGLEPYQQLARQNQTTLPEVLQRYVEAEDLLDREPIKGLLWLCQRYNVHPGQLMQAIGQGAPSTAPPQSNGANQNGAAGGYQIPPELAGLTDHLQALNQRISLFEQQQSEALDQSVASEIDTFGSDPTNRFFPNVRQEMGRLIQLADAYGQQMTLKEAYDRACWSHPEIRAHLIQSEVMKTKAVPPARVERARLSSSSLPPGSPVPGGTLTANEPANSLREEITRAFYGSTI